MPKKILAISSTRLSLLRVSSKIVSNRELIVSTASAVGEAPRWSVLAFVGFRIG